jgi:hypothetical protein
MGARGRGLAIAVAMMAVAGCQGPIDKLRHAPDRDVPEAMRCAPGPGGFATDDCLRAIAGYFGSKTGFHASPPDQASAATAALFVVRGHGELLPMPDTWIFAIREGAGPGIDALRLATATRMASDAPKLARALSSDDDARDVMAAVARSVVGACEAYAIAGQGIDQSAVAPERRLDHAPCVQMDLDRSSGPPEHGRYGVGTLWRGAEGALAIWRETARALREGRDHGLPDTQTALDPKLDAIDAALAAIKTPKMAPPSNVMH